MSEILGTGKFRNDALRGRLLRGASFIALAAAVGVSPASAQSLSALRAVVSANNAQIATLLKPQSMNQQSQNAAGMSAATARAVQYQAQVAQALNLAQQAQAAARQAVLGSVVNVPDGLVIGGLQPVADPVPAAQDPTGLNTWQGATQPTETKSGKTVQVTVQQTQQRAVLSWTTFNIGPNTTLNFNQTHNGVAEPSWTVLNRVVGQLDPATGLRDYAGTPTEIFGSIKAQGTVLIIDQNGILFGGSAQINVNSLIATSLEVGPTTISANNTLTPTTIADRNSQFLYYGLLGFADAAPPNTVDTETFSAQSVQVGQLDPLLEGEIEVNAGANIQANTGGFVLLTGPKVVNSGQLTAPEGQVSLEGGRLVTLKRSTGAATSADRYVRGFVLTSADSLQADGTYAENTSTGIIDAPQGYVSLESNDQGAAINDGILEATTSVSRDGDVDLMGGNIQLGSGSVIAISPDNSQETIPHDPTSLLDFKQSQVNIGDAQSLVEIQHNSIVYAPSGDVTVGASPGATLQADGTPSRVFIDSDAIIDVAGLPNILIPASRNSIEISPVTGNDLQDTPTYRDSFLNGATVYVDPRLSGVNSDGVAWVGSPLIPAASYAEQVGVTVQELMTKGGNVSLGVQAVTQGENPSLFSDITVKTGAIIDVSGGWVTYQAGWVQTTELIDAAGNIVNIGDANPNDTYIGIYNGFTSSQPRWGITQTFANPLLTDRQYEGQYTEGRDAGSLTLQGSTIVLDGTVFANSFPGPVQLADAQVGTAASSVYGDARALQGAPSQLPSGGFLFVQALGVDANNSENFDGGGDIDLVSQSNYEPVSSTLAYGQSISIDSNGNLIIPTRDPASYLPQARIDTISLSADALSAMGLSDVALETSGQIDIEQGANLKLNPGGAFDAVAGRTITVDGSISVPSGTINMQTVYIAPTLGSVFVPEQAGLGSFDIVVNGTLSTRGLWTNDLFAGPGTLQGKAYIGGGNIDLFAAPSVLLDPDAVPVGEDGEPTVNTDLSGSILINSGSLLDVSGGGYVSPTGALNLSARGGNVSLIDETGYFQLANDQSSNFYQGGFSGFRVPDIDLGGVNDVAVNPSSINARVAIAPGTILANGFAGGGTFTLTTPEISFGDQIASVGTELPLDFFSQAGFANYNITSYKTDLLPNTFYDPNNAANTLGGYNAVLATQVLTIGAGQTLDLSQSYFALALNSPALAAAQTASLRELQSGGDIYSVLAPSVPTDAWDRKAVNLTLGGLIELQVAKGGTVVDDAGGVLTVSQLDNEGTIRIPGGTINQTETLPSTYGSATGLGVSSLSQAFVVNPDGSIDEDAIDTKVDGGALTNGQVAADYQIYLLGTLGANEGIHLAPGSVTDLSGTSIRDPRAISPGQKNFVTGDIVGGGTLEASSTFLSSSPMFHQTFIGTSVYTHEDPQGLLLPLQVMADADSTINLSGASDIYDELGTNGAYVPTQVWSNAGTLQLGNGGTLTGADILAQGGASAALGGTLIMQDPVFYQGDPTSPTLDAISAQAISSAGFSTFVAQGSISSVGDATIDLSRAFFLTSMPYNGAVDVESASGNDSLVPVVHSGGALEISAPYIGFDSVVQSVSSLNPDNSTPGDNSVLFKANQIDVVGAVLFDNSVANATLEATGDVRFIGVEPAVDTLDIPTTSSVPNSLAGQLAVNGNLTIDAAQVYPTTGSTFYLTSSATNGTITFASPGGTAPAAPYSAGANLTIQAANIELGGVLRVPVGSLIIGADTSLSLTTDGTTNIFAPATVSVQALSGSITSVSANGLSIPYGTTTDQTEWYFAPTTASELTAPPAAILQFGGTTVSLNSGATVDVSGGGDLYAYEFIPGTGGSRDVLSRYNPDEFSGNDGYQYPNGEQVYAIVPGLSSTAAAAYDPIYSGNYSDLYSATNVGQSVYLSAAPGLAAGWYTLLPAQYAMLPGGMRVVEQLGNPATAPGTYTKLSDGTLEVAGYFGVAGTDSRQSNVQVFDVQSQSVFDKYSEIALTSANSHFSTLAAEKNQAVPRLPLDAGRIIIAPSQSLDASATFLTSPGQGGRGAEADITGASFDIVSELSGDSDPGTIELTAGSLTDLNAASLLIGGVRTDNADGTTSLDVTAQSITVDNDSSHPLTGPEIILAVDGSGAGVTLADGATIIASGKDTDSQTGNYIIDGSVGGETGQGALVAVSTGSQRLITRENPEDVSAGVLTVGQVNLEGSSLLLDSSGNFTVAPNAAIVADALALGASQVTFTSNGTGLSGLVITPELQALFGQSKQLTITSPQAISFSSGDYTFGNIQFDTPGLSLLDGNAVTLKTGVLTLSNDNGALADCETAGMPACGSGSLTIDASEIDFAGGTVNTYGFGDSTTLAAPDGMFMTGNGVFDAGNSALNIETPFLGDRALTLSPGESADIPSLTLTTTGAVTVSNPSGAAVPSVAGTPGTSLTIQGQSVSISDSELRATAGSLAISSATSITVSGDAVLETPSYAETLGDPADPKTVSAPGGSLTLTAADGSINLDSGTTLSVGGTSGTAGTLSLLANKGDVVLDGTLDGSAPDGGGSFNLATGGAFDLSAFSQGLAAQFTGTIDIASGAGNLTLAAGDTLKAANVALTADGGLVDIAGTIDVSGVNGGDVDLFGLSGVKLESTALVDAHANGYGRLDTRQATGGTVNIGTDQNGGVTVDSGAVIDVAALQTEARLVPMTNNGVVYYTFVPGDTGGTVNFRLPVIQQQGGDTVNMTYAGTIDGASSIVLQGFEHFNLADIAADPNFVGVTINDSGQAVLDVSAVAGQGQANFLADNAPGTLVNFVQGFNISAAYGNLGGLASQANFHARPGMELDYSGDIVLSSNWNLGAGVVDQQAAYNAGLMAYVPGSNDTQYYILPGDDAAVFSRFTTMTYRVGGSVLGEPGVLTLRAGGNLDINGSITDGFFQFGDQTDPNYLDAQLGGGNEYWNSYLAPSCRGSNTTCNGIGQWEMLSNLPSYYIQFMIPAQGALGYILDNPAPYSAAANSPAALGDQLPNDGGTSDALGSMQLFPLVNGKTYVNSWSYQLVAGANLSSANPTQTAPGATGSVVVQGINTYNYSAAAGGTDEFNPNGLETEITNSSGATEFVSLDEWYQAFLAANSALDPNSYTYIDFQQAPGGVKTLLEDALPGFFNQFQGQYQYQYSGKDLIGVTTTLAIAGQFMSNVIGTDEAQFVAGYKPPKEDPSKKPTTALSETLVRSGTGTIDVAAAQDINLQNGAVPTTETIDNVSYLVGGTAIYTAGHLADVTPETVVDELTGDTFTVDPSEFENTSDAFSDPNVLNDYRYGSGGEGFNNGYAGIFIANPVYADGGGDISLQAGHDILSRRDAYQQALLFIDSNTGGYDWIGGPLQPWRTGTIGDVTNIQINPQLFSEGVGALGGGDISVAAGNNIVDLSVVDDTSATTAAVSGTLLGRESTLALWQFGGGNVTVQAGNDLLGGRIDVASGSADITVGGDVESAGQIEMSYSDSPGQMVADTLRLRLSDATIDLSARGTVELEGITALGVQDINGTDYQGNLDAFGFYGKQAGVSVVADGSVTVDNNELDVVTPQSLATNDTYTAVYPGTLEASSLTGSLDLVTAPNTSSTASTIVLYPSPTGQLDLFAGGNIMPVTIDMEDGDPGILPGIFSIFATDTNGDVLQGRTFAFPGILPDTSQTQRGQDHDSLITHLDDPDPVYIDAGGDILDMIVDLPKQARIWAGQDIINMMFFGQNLSSTDVTRIVAGRDITATTVLVQPIGANDEPYGTPEATVEGNTFVIGGPGSFFLEAGRNLGPFLNSANTDGYESEAGGSIQATGPLSFAGGILSVGNDWNPWLPAAGANLYVEFGVSKGADYTALRDYYLDPSNLSNLPGYLFAQTTDSSGNMVPDRSQPIYEPILIQWMQTNEAAALQATYGTTNVTYQQAYTAFAALPQLQQQIFLLDDVYFNELTQTSIPTGASYKEYSRGYIAVNLLFPGSYGYTQNNLSGGGNGANQLVETGNLDLRLATIETQWGGNIYILGPGGTVLAGSTVATSAQAALRTYAGAQLFEGIPIVIGSNGEPVTPTEPDLPLATTIDSIPSGYEGILTLRGGSIDTFTDEDFLLNQSRLFTEDGGDIAMWSSNGSLNAGQGPKTSSDFPPIVVQVDDDLYSETDSVGGVTGAGIAAFEPSPGVPAPDVFLIAPRGTVDAGSAGVRVAGNLFVAAQTVANGNNFSVSGTSVGVSSAAPVNVSAQTSANSASAAAAEAASTASGASGQNQNQESIISVDVIGYDEGDTSADDERRKRNKAPGS